jgi:hypothetical protein
MRDVSIIALQLPEDRIFCASIFCELQNLFVAAGLLPPKIIAREGEYFKAL